MAVYLIAAFLFIACLAVAVYLRLWKAKEVAVYTPLPTPPGLISVTERNIARDRSQADFNIERFQRAIDQATNPDRVLEHRAWLAYYQALKAIETMEAK